MQTATLLVHPSTPAGLEALRDTCAVAVTRGTGTGFFELHAPDRAEMARRRDDVVAKGLPWLVAERRGRGLGFAYASLLRPRPAYRFSAEDSVYLHPDAQGRGVGRALLAGLLARCQAGGAWQMLAVIGDSANHGSIVLRRSPGFERCGLLQAVGWKFGRWLDGVPMQRALGAGAQGAAPDGAA
jgi:L-amino acid N-acyltransferase YncA